MVTAAEILDFIKNWREANDIYHTDPLTLEETIKLATDLQAEISTMKVLA